MRRIPVRFSLTTLFVLMFVSAVTIEYFTAHEEEVERLPGGARLIALGAPSEGIRTYRLTLVDPRGRSLVRGFWRQNEQSGEGDALDEWQLRRPNGRLSVRGAVENGVPIGKWTTYDERGNVAATVVHEPPLRIPVTSRDAGEKPIRLVPRSFWRRAVPVPRPNETAAIERLLRSADLEEVELGVVRAESFGRAGAAWLARLLDSEHAARRLLAAKALCRLGADAAPALVALRRATRDADRDVQWAAGLASFSASPAAERPDALFELLNRAAGADPRTRSERLIELAALGPRLVPAIPAVLRRKPAPDVEEADVRLAAVFAVRHLLHTIVRPRSEDAPIDRIAAWYAEWQELRTALPGYPEDLLEALRRLAREHWKPEELPSDFEPVE